MPTRREVKNTLLRRGVNFLASLPLGITLLVLFLPLMLPVAFLPQGLPAESYSKVLGEETFITLSKLGLTNVFHSTLFYVLLTLFLVNILFCTVKRIAVTGGPMRLFPSFFAHFFLIFLTGGFIQSSLTSAFEEIRLKPGVPYEVHYPFSRTMWAGFMKKKGKRVDDMPAGLTITLVKFREVKKCWRGKETILNWEIALDVKDSGSGITRKEIAVNRPLERGALKFYIWSFEAKAVFSVQGKRKELSGGHSYAGYKLLEIYPGGLACRGVKGPAVKVKTPEGELILEEGEKVKDVTFEGMDLSVVLGMKYDPTVSFISAFAFIFNFLLFVGFLEKLR